MKDIPLEIKGLIFSYLGTRQLLEYMKSSEECCTEIKKISKYITIDMLRIRDVNDIVYFTNMTVGTLDVNYIEITDKDLKLVSECIKRIGHIHLMDRYQVSDDGLKYLENIQSIHIDCCEEITDNGLAHLQNINTIRIYDNKNITNAGLKHFSNSNYIELILCSKINDDGFEYLANAHTVSISFIENITNNGIKKLKNVRHLQLDEQINITDDCFKYLGNVEVLYLSNNSLLTDDGLKYLSNINFLKVYRCMNITVNGINKLLEKRPKLIWSINDMGNNGSNEMNFFDYLGYGKLNLFDEEY
jgi:hypothetical protein